MDMQQRWQQTANWKSRSIARSVSSTASAGIHKRGRCYHQLSTYNHATKLVDFCRLHCSCIHSRLPSCFSAGSWSTWTQCNAPCNSTGQISRTYNITTPAAHCGQACPAANGAVETQPCTGDPCPPPNIDCQGTWGTWSACNVTECGMTGEQSRTYNITAHASGNGTACEAVGGASEAQACSTAACPEVDCVGR